MTRAEITRATMLALSRTPRRFEGEFHVARFTIDTRLGRISAVYPYPQSAYDANLSEFGIKNLRLKGDVYWGDGTKDSLNNASIFFDSPVFLTHTYSEPGVYHVAVTGHITSMDLGHQINSPSGFAPCFEIISVDSLILIHASATGFYTTPSFDNCVNLTSVPVFPIPENVSIIGGGGFYNCCSIQTIPNKLFYNKSIGNLFGFFEHCTSLTSIPGDLFSMSEFGDTCLFDRCFAESGITSIPATLFDKLKSQSFDPEQSWLSFESCFAGTPITSIPSDLFNGLSPASLIFKSCFNGCSNVVSNVPELWNQFSGTSELDYGRCFYGCVNAANYADIPSDWK